MAQQTHRTTEPRRRSTTARLETRLTDLDAYERTELKRTWSPEDVADLERLEEQHLTMRDRNPAATKQRRLKQNIQKRQDRIDQAPRPFWYTSKRKGKLLRAAEYDETGELLAPEVRVKHAGKAYDQHGRMVYSCATTNSTLQRERAYQKHHGRRDPAFIRQRQTEYLSIFFEGQCGASVSARSRKWHLSRAWIHELDKRYYDLVMTEGERYIKSKERRYNFFACLYDIIGPYLTDPRHWADGRDTVLLLDPARVEHIQRLLKQWNPDTNDLESVRRVCREWLTEESIHEDDVAKDDVHDLTLYLFRTVPRLPKSVVNRFWNFWKNKRFEGGGAFLYSSSFLLKEKGGRPPPTAKRRKVSRRRDFRRKQYWATWRTKNPHPQLRVEAAEDMEPTFDDSNPTYLLFEETLLGKRTVDGSSFHSTFAVLDEDTLNDLRGAR